MAGAVDWGSLQLTPEDGFLLSRVDGNTTVDDLVHLAGMPREQLQGALDQLVKVGVLEAPPVEEAAPPVALEDPTDEQPLPTEEPPPAEEEEEQPEVPADPNETREYRKLFETELHPLEKDVRMARAAAAKGAELFAFCFDPDPMVIKIVLDHLDTGLEHARLIADHHRNPVGLDALAHRAEFLRDTQVQRLLLRNVQLPDTVFKLIMGNKPLQLVYKLTLDKNVAERSITRARTLLRSKFATASAEERVNLIFSTEGRVLLAVTGVPLDSRSVQLLCARSWNNTLLIQNVCKFPGATPPLLMHIAKQPSVKRQPHLKTLLLQHPNASSELKRVLNG